MTRKIGTPAKPGARRKTPKRQGSRKSSPRKKSRFGKKPTPKSASGRKKIVRYPTLAGVRPPPPGRGKRGEKKGYLAYLLRQAQAATRLTLERALADLARVALLTPQTVGVIIRNLERDGAIRKNPHPVHGRVLQWTLTRRGERLLGKCRAQARALERRLQAGLAPKAQTTIRRWLSKIAADL